MSHNFFEGLSRFVVTCICAGAFFSACSDSDSGTSAGEDSSSSIETSSASNTSGTISYSVASGPVVDSWSKLNFNVDPNHIFGDTSFTTWPDDILEIGRATRDSILVVAVPNIPLIDMISGAYYRNYMKNSNYARTFRITVEDNDEMRKDSIMVRVTTKDSEGKVYDDVPPVDMKFYNVGSGNGKIYFQHFTLKGDSLGKPVLFSQRAEDAGDFEETYVLTLKTSATDKIHFVLNKEAK